MKFLLSILLGLSLSMPAFSDENLNTNSNDEKLVAKDSDTFEITLDDKNSTKEVEALVKNYFYNFGRTLIFTTKSTRFVLRNRGIVPIYINNIGVRGNGFFETENCPQFLFFGQRCAIRVFFRPNHIGNFNGVLFINLGGSEDIRVFLFGRGVFGTF